jgi:alginate O-acetyltransferase complex protein AlgI
MLFNSISFAIYLPLVFVLYWFVFKNFLRVQNVLLLVASYVFYAWWDWRFLFLLVFISLSNYLIGLLIRKSNQKNKKKRWLILGLFINISTLVLFKYFNFFIDSFIDLFSIIGYTLSFTTIRIILPLGISFYLFLSISYIIDIYNKKLDAKQNILEVLLTLSFFPIILAGPIQRPLLLLPQIKIKRKFNYEWAVDGLRQILWGLFVKIVIADNLAVYVNDIFNNYHQYQGSTLLIGSFFYSLQIYADFSSYSNIAIGTAKLFGFKLMRNFAYPYFARDITEFWKRWHISLTTWFRDYVFLPIAFSVSRKIKSEKVAFISSNLLIYIIGTSITWLLTGLWHGANYTFVFWGMIHAVFLVIYQWQRKPRKKLLKKLNIKNSNFYIVAIETIITFLIVNFAWIFFRTNSIQDAFSYLNIIFSKSLFKFPEVHPKMMLLLIVLFILIEWFQRNKEHALHFNGNRKLGYFRWPVYLIIILLIIILGGTQQEFIYFQF